MAYDRDIQENGAADATGINNPGVNPRAEQIVPGTPVFDAAGEQIGDVSDAGFTDGLLRVHQYGIFPRDLAVAMDAIARTEACGVYLTLTKDQMKGDKGDKRDIAGQAGGATRAPARPASSRPTDMATDSGSPRADLDVSPEGKRQDRQDR